MTAISLKIPEALLREVEEAAAARGVPKSAVIRESLERTFQARRKRKPKASCLDLVSPWVGTVDGPPDASTASRYLDEAIMVEHRRGTKNPR